MHLGVKQRDSVGQAEFLRWTELCSRGHSSSSLNLYMEQVETGLEKEKKLSKIFTVHSFPFNNWLEVLS